MNLTKDVDIAVEYLTRVEGHGNVRIVIRNGKMETCHLEVIEAPRFFEAMVKGRSIFEVQHITSRICGICSTGHSLASIKAAEDAIGFEPTEQTRLLRKLLLHYETLDSHLLHAYVLVAPDALGAPSILPLLASHKDVILMALRMKKQWSDVCDILAGRHTHPITCCVRGFTKLPTKEELVRMRDIILSQEKDLAATLDIFKTVTLPAFERETEYVALSHPGEYAFLEGDVVSSDTKKAVGPRDYLQVVHEFHEPHSTSKHAKNVRDSYFVGALARANINFDKLDKEAKAAAAALGFSVPCHNPFMNTVAQVVEYVHCYHDALRILDRFIRDGIDYGQAVTSWPRNSELAGGAYKVKAGRGVGAVEVPRGVLFHDYTVKEDATIEKANCVIPTNQNLANIDLDMKKMIPEIIDLTKEQITLRAEMLVRAYDPCISCSCHLVKVDFAD